MTPPRTWAVPDRYASYVIAAIGRAIEAAQIDAYRRRNGFAPSIDDMELDASDDGDLIVIAGEASASLVDAVRIARMKVPA